MILIVLKHFLKHIFLDSILMFAFIDRFYFYLVKCIFLAFYSSLRLVLLYSASDHIHMYFALYK